MSRSGYDNDGTEWDMIRWRGAVTSAMRGKRGMAFLEELRGALDTMKEKRLIEGELVQEGEVCALGAIGMKRGIDMAAINPYDVDTVANTFSIAHAMAAEIMFMNDEGGNYGEPPERRHKRMCAWIDEEIAKYRRTK
mgnify:FL=1